MTTFIKTVEDFTCDHCGTKVKGNGFTNHCPKCLYSKHVDINPGDRNSACNSLMEPKNIYTKDGRYYIVHVCTKCRFQRANGVEKSDDFSKVIALSQNQK